MKIPTSSVAGFLVPSVARMCRCLLPTDGSLGGCLTTADVYALNMSTTGHLINAAALPTANEMDADAALGDPIYLTSSPGFAYWNGYQNGWYPADIRSAYAVLAVTDADITATVNFAAQHNLRLVVKGTGHDFLARSSAPGSLMLSTHKLRSLEWHDSIEVCGELVLDALTVGAGGQLNEIHLAAQDRGRFFLGGNCSTVGHAGFSLGGGFGFLSNYYGSGATNILQADVVLANGTLVTATPCNEYSDLLMAMRGGGGGTFGVATKITYRTHPYPRHFGKVSLAEDSPSTSAHDNTTAQAIAELFTHLRDVVIPMGMYQHIGGNVIIGLDGAVKFALNFVDISEWQCYELFARLKHLKVSCTEFTDKMYPEPGALNSSYGPPHSWYGPLESTVAGTHLAHIINRQINSTFLAQQNGPEVFGAWVQNLVSSMSAHIDGEFSRLIILLHFGFAHSSELAVRNLSETSTHPAMRNSYALVMWERMLRLPYGQKLSQLQAKEYAKDAQTASEKFDAFFDSSAVSQFNINGYHEPNFKERYWGSRTYTFLDQTKRKYDPQGLFWCHTCVGSDSWTTDGNCPVS